jgi:C1A family cysteine protease
MKTIASRALLTLLTTGLVSCSDAQQLYDNIRGKIVDVDEEDYIPVPGAPASEQLSKALSNSTIASSAQLKALDIAIEDQSSQNLVALGLAASNSETTFDADQATFDELVGSEKKKKDLDPDSFAKLSSTYFEKSASLNLADYTSDSVDWGNHSDTSFAISALERMPVRNQGQRGTCASFAGVSLIESLIIQQNSSSLPFKEIDLSEQRFYYLSKPESWSTGGSIKEQGSDSGSGFMTSNGELSGYSGPSDTGGTIHNIPLEADCPYNAKPGSNDLQIPLAQGCKSKGAVRVTKFTAWAGSKGNANNIERAQHIYNELRLDKAVIVYTKLSKNWESNDGMVTYAKAGSPGASSHASGHAFLIVGAKKIDEAAFPGEGGMCFVIRNSWGTGWGVKGLSCMTLKWFNHWRFPGSFPTVDEVELISDAKQLITVSSKRPQTVLPEPDPATRKDRSGGKYTRRRGEVSFAHSGLEANELSESFVDAVRPWLPQSTGKQTLQFIDMDLLTADDMNYGKLVTDNDQTYKILYTANGTQFVMRGILAGDDKQTHALELMRTGSLLIANLEGRGDVIVGDFLEVTNDDGSTGLATVCGGKYASVCDLNYDTESNELLIGLSKIEAKRQVSRPPYNWKKLAIAGYGLEMSQPESALTKFDIRVIKNGNTSEPQRMKLNAENGEISHKGSSVGSLTSGELCSGSYRSTCRIVQTEKNFEILPKGK